MTHLDTTFLIDLLRERTRGFEGPASVKLDELAEEPLAVSVHVVCELHAGAELSTEPGRERSRVARLIQLIAIRYPDEHFAPVYGALLAELERRGERFSTMDLLIAASAVMDQASIVTRNARDFERVPQLGVIAY